MFQRECIESYKFFSIRTLHGGRDDLWKSWKVTIRWSDNIIWGDCGWWDGSGISIVSVVEKWCERWHVIRKRFLNLFCCFRLYKIKWKTMFYQFIIWRHLCRFVVFYVHRTADVDAFIAKQANSLRYWMNQPISWSIHYCHTPCPWPFLLISAITKYVSQFHT